MINPLLERCRLIGRNRRPDAPYTSRLADMRAADLYLVIGRSIEQTPLSTMCFNGKWSQRVDKACFDDPHRALWVAQHGNGIILNGPPGHISIGGADALRQAQQDPSQVHGVSAQIDHCSSRRLLRIEKGRRQPSLRVKQRPERTIVKETRPDLRNFPEKLLLQNLLDSQRRSCIKP